MALLAAIALAVTVYFAQRALTQASLVVMRGEANALVSSIIADLAREGGPPSEEFLAKELTTHQAKGLRYVAIAERGTDVVAEAGTATIKATRMRPEEPIVVERRVRAASILPPPRPGFFDLPPPPAFGPMMLVVELEPPVIVELRKSLMRISVVGSVAAVVLVAFAIAWSRSANRLAAIEQRAAREQRLVALGSMSSVMAHELRNPLASLKGHAQLLVEDLTDDKARQKAERVVSDAQRLEVLTTSLLDFVRDGPIETAPTSARSLVERALEDLDPERVTIAGNAELAADAPRLSRALHNVIDNALKAGPEHVDVTIASDDGVSIAVRDRGEGLPKDTQIFDPFVTTRTRGTGLGLPVARRIAEQHGGTLTAAAHPDGGAVFTFRLPHKGGS